MSKPRGASWTFFAVNIRNRNTRAAYGQAADAQPVLLLGCVEELSRVRKALMVKQYLTCIRMLCDWLVIRQMIATNPAHVVRGPRHSVIKGATTVMSSQEANAFLSSIYTSHLVGLRPRHDRRYGLCLRPRLRCGRTQGGRLLSSQETLVAAAPWPG